MYFSSHASLLNAMVGGVYQNYAAFGGAAAMLKEGDTSSSEDPDGYTARNAFRSLLRTFGKTASPHVITGLATGQQAQLNAIYAETWHDSTK